MDMTTASIVDVRDETDYDAFLGRVRSRFLVNSADGPLFATDADGLFDLYLSALPEGNRQHYNCHACRHFFGHFGGLVTIDEAGRTRPAIWDEADAPEYHGAAIAALVRTVGRARVTGVFLSSEPVWGRPETGVWHHVSVTPPPGRIYRGPLLTAEQMMAGKTEDFRNVSRALAEFTSATLAEALRVLEADALYRTEKVIGPARWLADLHAAIARVGGGKAKDNMVWRAVATAPAGFCHPRSSMVGTLLDDIAAGMDFGEVSRRFAAKMHPLQYQRPQAAPSAGNIAEAEKVVEKIGIARSLLRRFARLDEVEAIWKPTPVVPAEGNGGGVFAHLKPKGSAAGPTPLVLPPTTITWEKFARTVLPTAEAIEFLAPARNDNYTALTTAADPDAPPIFQWDAPDRRNPVAWYVWMGGSPIHQWGLASGCFHAVTAVAAKPCHWGGARCDHHGAGVVLVLDGARDTRMAGAAIFPETLRPELHGIRATIEAYSRAGTIAESDGPLASGLMFEKGSCGMRLRVRRGGTHADYDVDRWD